MSEEFTKMYIKLARNGMVNNILRSGVLNTQRIREQTKQVFIETLTSQRIEHDKLEDTKQLEAFDSFVEIMSGHLEESIQIQNFQHQVLGIILCQHIQAFDCYLRRMLSQVFNKHYTLLDANSTIRVEEVLQFNSREEFIAWRIDKKLHDLDYKGFKGVLNYLKGTVKLDFKLDAPECEHVSEMFLCRNIIVHNDGYVNGMYLEKSGKTDLKLGDLYPLTEEYISEATRNILKLGQLLDSSFDNQRRGNTILRCI